MFEHIKLHVLKQSQRSKSKMSMWLYSRAWLAFALVWRVLSINKPIIGAQWSVTWHAAQTFTDLGCAPHKKKEFSRASQSAVYFSLDRGSSSVG